jgi:GNAT superfamily N-acetyltransferase
MEIVRLGRGDEDRLRDIRLRALADAPQAFASTLAREQTFTRDVWTSRLTDAASVNLLAVENGEPVAMATGRLDDPGTAHLLGMWVAPQARGGGVAARLIDAVTGWARDRGARHLVLWVTDVNRAARALYDKSGFRPTGERQPLPSATSLMESKLSREIGGLLVDCGDLRR